MMTMNAKVQHSYFSAPPQISGSSGSVTYLVQIGSGGMPVISGNSFSGANFILHPQGNHQLLLILDQLRTVFKLTREELANICLVTRKSFYNWQNGESEPREKTFKRIFELNLIARACQASGARFTRDQIRSQVLESKSILELLMQRKLDQNKILFAASRLQLQQTSKSIEDPFA